MMPSTVPNRPTNGAVAPMVARTPRFSFSSATTTTVLADQFIELKSAPRLISMVQFPPKAAGATGRKSVQFEVDGEVEEDVHRLPVERPRLEFPAPDRFHGRLVEAERQRLEHV